LLVSSGYDELIDMTAVERIEVPSGNRVRELAALSSTMDSPAGSPTPWPIWGSQTIRCRMRA